jgi:hypothetical protein
VPPLNNRTLVLYFSCDAASRAGGLFYQSGRIAVIPCSADQFPVLAKIIPCFNLQGTLAQDIEINA